METTTPTALPCGCIKCAAHQQEIDEIKIRRRAFGLRDLPNLRAIRESRYMTQNALARAADVSVRQVINLEQGQNGARGITATKLAIALNTTLEELEGRVPLRDTLALVRG